MLTGCRPEHNPGVCLTLALLVLLAAADAPAGWTGDTRPLMGTEVQVYLWSDDETAGREIVDAVFAEAERVAAVVSTYSEASELSRVNAGAAAEPVAVSAELFGLIQRSLDLSVLTLGAFDVTVESVGHHYDIESGRRPDAAAVDSARELINFRYVHLDAAADTVAFLKEGVRINLGGIANGYLVERGADILRVKGVSNAIVTAGGDSRVLGDRRGQPWLIGIRNPGDDGDFAVSVALIDEAISTSGDYERTFAADGSRYHEIIEPSSGDPAGGLRSATVFGPDAVLTDALATAIFVLGVDKGLTLLGTLPDYEGIIIGADGSMHYSEGVPRPAPAE